MENRREARKCSFVLTCVVPFLLQYVGTVGN